ncbi:hypothetical protein BCV70DRAFT_155231 [Testicularia cyperi]|uniref:Membrane anchor Opy2 N-terminal domain-containing protein n=1 Tax=Testicularia cyperi TaxID=1882483 RepID=A0A317Y030_9BASI|nr:hypothetical protein BCV70DRAFT_155231 [Testicularia cyperi]
MTRPTPTAFLIRKKRDSCAVCDNIAPCPSCPSGYQCQQIFRSSCQDCPVNKCVAIPGYSSSSSSKNSALGGGLGALLGVVVIGALVFWYRRKRRNERRRIALQETRDRLDKAKSEKQTVTLQLNGSKVGGGGGADGQDLFVASLDPSDFDHDTEYTQVTGVLSTADNGGSLAEPTLFKRRSFGAATHLSRITEGVEEEEDELDELSEKGNGNKRASARSKATSIASGAGPRISIGSGTSFGSKNIIPIAFKPSSSPSLSPNQAEQLQHYHPDAGVTMPSAAHRPTGAPVVPPFNTGTSGPVRPVRAPDLNLRLPSATDHLPTTPSPLSLSSTSEPAVSSAQTPYGFMSIDPVESLNPSMRADRHLSTMTTNTIGSVNSISMSYVMSAPQVITPVSSEGVRRVQVGKGGKAQLVKVPSLKRKPVPAVNDVDGAEKDPFSDPEASDLDGDLAPPPSNRFERNSSAADAGRNSAMSTSTLGIPFGENPFAPFPLSDSGIGAQISPSDAVDRSSWLGSFYDGERDPRESMRQSSDLLSPPSSAARIEDTRDSDSSMGGISFLGQFPFADLPRSSIARTSS